MNQIRFRALGLIALAVVIAVGAARPVAAFTLIVAPARYSVLQVAQDVLQRSPSVLVSYQGEASTAEPALHAWNGREWVPVSLKDFREVNFLQKLPDLTILIGSDDVLPRVLQEAASWSPRIERITDMSTGALINDFGRILQWRSSDWQWFARRYNLTLTDEAAERRSSSWYDQPGPLPDRPRITPLPGARPVRPVESAPAVAPASATVAEPEPVPVVSAPAEPVP